MSHGLELNAVHWHLIDESFFMVLLDEAFFVSSAKSILNSNMYSSESLISVFFY